MSRGRLVKDRSSKGPKLNCRNWECGVVIPVSEPSVAGRIVSTEDMEIFEGHVPVPMQLPGGHYEEKVPWFFMEPGH
jgi:hypothetical protein